MKNAYINGFAGGFLHPLLTGFGQILLQENRLSGCLVIAGIFAGSVVEGVTALLSGALALTFAKFCRFPENRINSGLYVFNAVLFGIAVVHFFPVSIPAVLLIIIGSAVATLLTHGFLQIGLPAFTFPFILLSWVAIYGINMPGPPNHLPDPAPEGVMVLSVVLKGFAQVIFQINSLSGLLFLLAILANSGRSAIYALAAVIVGSGIAWLAGLSPDSLQSGTFGYNPLLCCLAFAGAGSANLLRACCACLLSTVLIMPFFYFGIVPLTFPFVGATWAVLGISRVVNFSKHLPRKIH